MTAVELERWVASEPNERHGFRLQGDVYVYDRIYPDSAQGYDALPIVNDPQLHSELMNSPLVVGIRKF